MSPNLSSKNCRGSEVFRGSEAPRHGPNPDELELHACAGWNGNGIWGFLAWQKVRKKASNQAWPAVKTCPNFSHVHFQHPLILYFPMIFGVSHSNHRFSPWASPCHPRSHMSSVSCHKSVAEVPRQSLSTPSVVCQWDSNSQVLHGIPRPLDVKNQSPENFLRWTSGFLSQYFTYSIYNYEKTHMYIYICITLYIYIYTDHNYTMLYYYNYIFLYILYIVFFKRSMNWAFGETECQTANRSPGPGAWSRTWSLDRQWIGLSENLQV